jgi:hypothetical protein
MVMKKGVFISIAILAFSSMSSVFSPTTQNAAKSGESASNPLLTPASSSTKAPAAIRDFGKIPVYFVPNQGQMNSPVDFYILGKDKTIYFTPVGITFALILLTPALPEIGK